MAEKFHTELDKLKGETVEMAHFGRSMLRDAVDGLIRQDKNLAESVVARKEEIHHMEVRLEEHCYQLIALNQQMAKDMRIIACTLKVITASLRIGRYGKVIANIVREVADNPHIANLMSLPHMADGCMVHGLPSCVPAHGGLDEVTEDVFRVPRRVLARARVMREPGNPYNRLRHETPRGR